MKKYIRIDNNNIVTYIHYQPLDPIFGLNATEEELLLSGGFLVDDIPVPEHKDGMISVLKYTPNESGGEFSFDYIVDESIDSGDAADNGKRIAALERLLNFLILDDGIVFDTDENGVLKPALVPYINYIVTQIKSGNIAYDAIINKYPNIREELDASM